MSEEKVKHIHKILSSISGKEPEVFKDVDVEDPVSWSNALKPFGWKLTFCNSKLDYIIENVFNMDEDGKYIVEVCVDGAWAFGQKLLHKEQNDEGYALNKGLLLVEVEDNSIQKSANR